MDTFIIKSPEVKNTIEYLNTVTAIQDALQDFVDSAITKQGMQKIKTAISSLLMMRYPQETGLEVNVTQDIESPNRVNVHPANYRTKQLFDSILKEAV